MNRQTMCVVAALVIALAIPASAQPSLLQKLLRIAGLTAAPSQLRGPGDVADGEVWTADVRTRMTRPIAQDGGYRSPVFAPADGTLYALKGDMLVRLADRGAVPLMKVPGAVKLVGFDPEAGAELVFLRDGGAGVSPLGIVAIDSGAIVPIPVDMTAADERQMVTYIRGDERAYGDVRVFTRADARQGAIRAVEWTDVFLQRGTEPAVNMSNGAGISSAQPALSPDGTRVAYIRIQR